MKIKSKAAPYARTPSRTVRCQICRLDGYAVVRKWDIGETMPRMRMPGDFYSALAGRTTDHSRSESGFKAGAK